MSCASQSRNPGAAEAQRERELVFAAEDAYVAAEVSRNEAALRSLVDDKFVYNAADGTTSGKEELIRNVLRMKMTGQTISERSVLLEAHMAVIFGTAELQFGGTEQPSRTSRHRYTAVYVKREGMWRMLTLQMQARSTQ